MKSKKEQMLLKLQKKFYKWGFKFNFLLHPLTGVTQTPTFKGACSTQLELSLGTTPLVQQFKNIIVPTGAGLLPLAEITTIKSRLGSNPAHNPLGKYGLYLRYEPLQKKHSVSLFMLRMHLKQLKTWLKKNVLYTVRLPCVVPTYCLNPFLETTLLPPDRVSGSRMLTWLRSSSRRSGSVVGVKGNKNTTSVSLSWVFIGGAHKTPTVTCADTLVPPTETIALCPVKTNNSQGSRVSKASLPKVTSGKKKNSPKDQKVAYTQEDLVRKTSHFINLWCYLQMIFFFFHTLKQPMVVVDCPHLGKVNSLTCTTDSLFPKGCFLIWVNKWGYYPWRRQLQRVFVLNAAYGITWGPVQGITGEVVALSFLPQLKLGYPKDWLPPLEEKVLPTVGQASPSKSKNKNPGGIFCKPQIPSPQPNNFYKYLGFCDYIILKMVWKWCSRQHSNQSAQWIRCHYFYKLNGQSWVFALKKILFNPACLANYAWHN